MNFDLTDEQEMMRDTFARFLDDNSSTERVRKAQDTGGFDAGMWAGLAELGAFAMRVSEQAGGMGLGLFDAGLLMEEAGRTLVSGPLAEALVATRLLGQLGGQGELLESAIGGEKVVTIAMQDIAEFPSQWVAGGLVADAVIARKGDDVVLIPVPAEARIAEPNLASTPIAELDLAALPATVLGSGEDALAAFASGIEEWKLLMTLALSGLSRAALMMAAEYAGERKAFGVFIGTFQALSHPMADLICEIDSAKFLAWKAMRSIADGEAAAGAQISLAAWYAAGAAGRTVRHAVQTFGGIGLTTEHDIHLYNLRAKAWPLIAGDPEDWLTEAGRRLYAAETTNLPDAGEVPVEFDLGEDARAIQQEIHEFFARNVTDEQREKFHFSWEGHNPVIHKQLVEANLAYLQLPKDIGGRGLSPYAVTAARDAFEEEGWNNPIANVAQMVALIMYRFGTDELKRDVLSKVMSGDAICSLGYSEPGCGSDVFAAKCKATQQEDGSWLIDGTKMWTSGANLTDYVLMLCRTDPDAPKHKGLTMFIVPLKAEGVTVQAVHTFMDERTNVTFYDNVRIPDTWRLGEINSGGRTMAASLELEHGGGFAKVQRAMLESAVELCQEIPVAGGGKLIDTVKAQTRLARTYANVLSSELIAYRANWTQVHGKGNGAYGPMAKMFSSELFITDSRDLLDLTAPYSLSKRKGAADHVNLAYRHAHGTTIYGGTSQVHRSMIAEKGLGLPRSRN
ncbi:acyl-CoA dehydrogenase family protein [Novosphingobium mangrovi (ex Huang et al. 2023)]|uniref:Acyl-CoA dehydrogenase n=1 Tax=Novosphingobium mangrovi (ex Huang et al. 2023) TaxID=2976432 RepID=A0ABT2I7L4_9SPHN|nr:acyl-CoA dehydrogenase [Novosphingobium mangrovi (ex Huang et al. 2023)]MCT2400810.1 acyl-CoA dehydrogenase [Novosphingobium mangrovi (ex Huang et al. 2023)]